MVKVEKRTKQWRGLLSNGDVFQNIWNVVTLKIFAREKEERKGEIGKKKRQYLFNTRVC